MKISYNWLRQYLDFDLTPEETAEKLTLTGLEVEEIEETGTDYKGIVVGEVLSCKKHPNADRLSVCEVDIKTEKLHIVCGAPNIEARQKVVVATVGAELPVKLENGKNLIIRKSKIRGEASEGMICAEDELGLGHDHSGIIVLDNTAEPGTPVTKYYPSGKDSTFEIGLTPNRPDASSHIGVARDLAAVLQLPLKNPLDDYKEHGYTKDLSEHVSIDVNNTTKCRRYAAMMVENITVKESPEWLKIRLKSIGLRPINNIVDVTNFILHETGQPLHTFDLDLLAGKKIIVQDFDHETKFTTLDDIERKVPAGSLFICDGEKPVAIAGVMGGQNSEINEGTKRALIESACFEPVSTRKTSKRLSLQSDSSYRFERGVDPNMADKAAQRCAALIAEVSGGTIVEAITDIYPSPVEPKVLTLRLDRMNKFLGSDISREQAAGILRSLEFGIDEKEDILHCKVPTFRPDVHGEVDLIEEVARIYDYNNIPNPDYLKLRKLQPIPFHEQFREKVRNSSKALGLKEIYSNSLLPENITRHWGEGNVISTLNPITKDQAILRPGLIHGFLSSADYNFKRKVSGVRFFEIGNVFSRSENGTYIHGVKEETNLLIGLAGNKTDEHWLQKPTPYTLFDLKSLVEGLFTSMGLGDKMHYQKDEQQALVITAGKEKIGTLSLVDKDLLISADI
ncbi:MAG: phenylalanine--tRNA ligase subunit beta, partial [Balneolales bacterium]